jgi:hypothetical protein
MAEKLDSYKIRTPDGVFYVDKFQVEVEDDKVILLRMEEKHYGDVHYEVE